MEKSNVFTVLVAGNNPEELISKYDVRNKVDKYIKYKYLDAKKMHHNEIKMLESIIAKNKNNISESIYNRLNDIKDLTDFDYYKFLTKGMEYDEDGNALSTENPNGQFSSSKIGHDFSKPFDLTDGTKVYQAKYGDIDWNKMHMNPDDVNMYTVIWNMIKNGVQPRNEVEENIYNNMIQWTNYFSNFNNVDEYVAHNCSFWHYAFCDKDKWSDIDSENANDKEWIKNFYEKFIVPLGNDELLTIFECKR